MAKRKYSVEEIDAMRSLVESLLPWGGSYVAGERVKTVEEKLRTYMLNGTTPAELKLAAEAHFERESERRSQMVKMDRRFRDTFLKSERTGA